MMKLSSRDVLDRVGWMPFAFVIVAAVVLSIAGLAWNTSPYYGHKGATSPVAEPVVAPVPSSTGTYEVPLAPTRIEIPKLKAKAPIVKVATLPNNELEIPENPKIVGWWSPGAQPGAKTGTAVIAGHINFKGVDGTLSKIGKLDTGDTVKVFGKYNATDKMVEFRVTAVRTYHKKALPYREIFDQKVAGRIALVTCGGPFDASTGNYLDNIVVYGVPVTTTDA